MRLPEQKLWDRFKPRLQKAAIYGERVENVVSVGMPDVLCLKDGVVTWVEMKQRPDMPMRDATPFLGDKYGLTVEQRNWHLDWTQRGGRSMILVGAGSHMVFGVHGKMADTVNAMNMRELGLLGFAATWDEVLFHLGARP